MKRWMTAASLLLCACAVAQATAPPATPAVQSAPAPAKEESLESAKRISIDDARKLGAENKAVFVDVRSKDQYDLEHIKGAYSIPLNELTQRVKELPPHREIITYCS